MSCIFQKLVNFMGKLPLTLIEPDFDLGRGFTIIQLDKVTIPYDAETKIAYVCSTCKNHY